MTWKKKLNHHNLASTTNDFFKILFSDKSLWHIDIFQGWLKFVYPCKLLMWKQKILANFSL